MGRELHFDVETRSTCDLRKAGADVYFEHPITDLWCYAYAFDDEPPGAWSRGEEHSDEVLRHIRDGGLVVAHNAGFEYLAINQVLAKRHGWPTIKFSNMRCTAAQAAAMALPRSLGELGKALGLDVTKDEEGRRLMMMMTKPRRIENGEPIWWDEPVKVKRLVNYCVTDVLTERGADKKLRVLSPMEHKCWQLDHKINARGVLVDIDAVRDAKKIVSDRLSELQRELQVLTDFAVGSVTQVARIKEWLALQGLDMDSLDKQALREALGRVHDPKLRRVLEIRQEASKASVAKLDAYEAGVSKDNRCRGLLMYHGAGTGRWTGMRLQPQNFPRPVREWKKHVSAAYFDTLPKRDHKLTQLYTGMTSVHATSNALKGFIVADKGNVLYKGDYSNIEGRVLAWLAGEQWKLDAFRAFDAGTGHDSYKLGAAGILTNITGQRRTPEDITDEERQSYGKVPELALGFQGGVVAFQTMAKNYDVSVTDEEADAIKVGWRQRHPAIVSLWYDLERTIVHAAKNPGKIFRVASPEWREPRNYQRIEYGVVHGFLWCRLPSGRLLAYMDPRIREVETPWGEKKEAVTYMGVDSQTRKWGRFAMYGGLAAENVTQAAARDMMRDAMFRLEDASYPIVLTVHDEIVAETPETHGSVEDFTKLMATLPPWAAGLPVAVDAGRGFRYQK